MPAVVISQLYGGGGNSGATFKNDFVELFNRGHTSVDLNGWTIQYAAATSTATWQVTNLSGVMLAPGQYYLVQEAAGAGGTASLPPPDASGNINLSATAGKVALVSNATALSGACPSGAAVVDKVGYGAAANCSEASPAPAPSNTTSLLRRADGCTDSDRNSFDFTTASPAPRNTLSSLKPCGVSPNSSRVLRLWLPILDAPLAFVSERLRVVVMSGEEGRTKTRALQTRHGSQTRRGLLTLRGLLTPRRAAVTFLDTAFIDTS